MALFFLFNLGQVIAGDCSSGHCTSISLPNKCFGLLTNRIKLSKGRSLRKTMVHLYDSMRQLWEIQQEALILQCVFAAKIVLAWRLTTSLILCLLLMLAGDQRRRALPGKIHIGNLHGDGSLRWQQRDFYRPPSRHGSVRRHQKLCFNEKRRGCLQQGDICLTCWWNTGNIHKRVRVYWFHVFSYTRSSILAPPRLFSVNKCGYLCHQGKLVFEGTTEFTNNEAVTTDTINEGRGGTIYHARIGTITFNGRFTATENNADVRTPPQDPFSYTHYDGLFFCRGSVGVGGMRML